MANGIPRTSQRFAALIDEMADEEGRGFGWKAAVARRLGVDRSTVSNVSTGKRSGVSSETIESAIKRLRIDPAYFHDPVLRDGGYRAYLKGGSSHATRPDVVRESRYPNLATTIAYWSARSPDRWSPATISAAESLALKSPEDPDISEWEAKLDAIQAFLSGLAEGSVGEEIGEDDAPAPPRGRKRR